MSTSLPRKEHRILIARRLSITLPIAFCILNLPLMLWDIYNINIIEHMGMAWDTGAPLWPYQASNIFFVLLNFPASSLGYMTANSRDLVGQPAYFIVFPITLLWWWLVGWWLDKRSTGPPRRRSSSFIALLYIVSLGFTVLGVYGVIHTVGWWAEYSQKFFSVTDFIFLRSITPSLWCFLFALAAAAAAKRRLITRRALKT
jgi:hypothetical protein